MSRDPRVDPKPGDVLAGYGGTQVKVIKFDGGIVRFVLNDREDLGDHRPIKAWTDWAKNATIIKLGDTP